MGKASVTLFTRRDKRSQRMLATAIVLILAAVLTATVGEPAGATVAGKRQSPTVPRYDDGRYIVVMKDLPVVAYNGRVRGYPASRPVRGTRFASAGTHAVRYRELLVARQDRLRRSAGVRALHTYTDSLNGFSAAMTGAQAARLAQQPQVVAVVKDVLRHIDRPIAATAPFLGLSGRRGVWSRLGGPAGAKGAGNGLVIGVIDSGIWPESPSFAPTTPNRTPPGWTGRCQTGERFAQRACNGKIIGARYYVDGFGASNVSPAEYLSPRDGNGHGSHTASTAAGNFNIPVREAGRTLGTISGMAPMARIAAYKACWTGDKARGRPDGCTTVDAVAAIEQAVKDGVDAINYSIGAAGESPFLDPVEVQFLFAADAGVFVSASAGNTGPKPSTLDHPSPWLTTVAASTYTSNEGTVVLGNGARYVGASITSRLPAFTPMMLSTVAAAPGVSAVDAALCAPNALSRSKAAGKVIVCDRGVIPRADKSFEVQRAGGVGMILVNTTPLGLNADLHPVPTVHLEVDEGAELKRYLASASTPVGKIVTDGSSGSLWTSPDVTQFSSRGPVVHASGDLLKPDIAAPGNDILAASAPPFHHRQQFDVMSGTSMAAPHIAGLSLLIKDKHRTWSPAMIRSAMMTTAFDTETTDIFAQGAGFVAPQRFLDPGLVYDAETADYLAFLDGQGVEIDDVGPIDASDLNQPSIVIGDLAERQTIRRTVTNVASVTSTYTARVAGLRGVSATVSPRAIKLKPGRSAAFTLTFTRSTAPLNAYAQGQLLWADGRHTVRSPIAIRPVARDTPKELSGTEASGTATAIIRAGFAGEVRTAVDGHSPVRHPPTTRSARDTATFPAGTHRRQRGGEGIGRS